MSDAKGFANVVAEFARIQSRPEFICGNSQFSTIFSLLQCSDRLEAFSPFAWSSRNLNLQLDARERHGVLFFIEQGLMPRTGKRFEWEVGCKSGDALSGMFQDFDWADEVLHAQIGRRWYVPRYKSLQEALAYGDGCWTKVVSQWHAFRDQGLTSHRNWWPELYREACERWNVPPDPLALSYNTTYEDSRADLQKL